MLFNFQKEKMIRISMVTICITVAVLLSLTINSRYDVGKAYDLHSRKVSEQILYIWSHKLSSYINTLFKNPISLIAGIGAYDKTSVSKDQRPARSVPVLVYHGLPNEGIGQLPHDSFVEHMTALKNAGWQAISLEQFQKFIDGEIEIHDHTFLLTFDDGRKDTFYPADPVLKDLGFRAVMFAISKKSAAPSTIEDSTYYMSLYELSNMQKSGRWDVESHGRDSHDWYYVDGKGTIGHFFSNKLWLEEEGRLETNLEYRERVVYDLRNSKIELENALDKEVKTIAFPFGDFGQDTVNYPQSLTILEEEASKLYDMGFHQTWDGMSETFNYPDKNRFMMKRIEPHADWSGEFLVSLLESGKAKDLPYTGKVFGHEWVRSWGELQAEDTLELQATESTTGASASLSGSWWWSDYTFSTETNWEDGSNIVLIARKHDEDNYFGCNFSGNKVYLKSTVDGASHNMMDADYPLHSLGNNMTLGVRVTGSSIECLVNNGVVLSAIGINQRIPNGGIGLEIWDPKLGTAHAVFDNVRVDLVANSSIE